MHCCFKGSLYLLTSPKAIPWRAKPQKKRPKAHGSLSYFFQLATQNPAHETRAFTSIPAVQPVVVRRKLPLASGQDLSASVCSFLPYIWDTWRCLWRSIPAFLVCWVTFPQDLYKQQVAARQCLSVKGHSYQALGKLSYLCFWWERDPAEKYLCFL